MAQYVYQVIKVAGEWRVGRLIKSFKVSPDLPIPSVVPADRQQLVSEDEEMFNAAVAFYKVNTTNAKYTITEDRITWELRSQ